MKCPFCNQQTATPRNPVPTVDIIIEVQGGIVLIERKNEPRGWALPGGFVDYGESFEQAAIREAKEETGLDIQLLEQQHTYSNPGRDPRMHTATTVFNARATGTSVAGDDAGRVKVFSTDRIPPLVFDHNAIVDDYLKRQGN